MRISILSIFQVSEFAIHPAIINATQINDVSMVHPAVVVPYTSNNKIGNTIKDFIPVHLLSETAQDSLQQDRAYTVFHP